MYRREAAARLLLEIGADFEIKDCVGWSPILYGARHGHEGIVRLLLEKGADFEGEDDDFRTPLSWAAEGGHTAVVRLLLERGAKLEQWDNTDWQTVLDKDDHKAIRRLMRQSYGFRSSLSRAAANGHEEVVRLLLEHGADPEMKDCHGQTPLQASSKSYLIYGFE
ncbi:ankyrin repeat-containing domain protein [Bisporella sp. PMI_857]|nr:ankyrin repeat-containing domain protein [Bisporella sp. PMI_857]